MNILGTPSRKRSSECNLPDQAPWMTELGWSMLKESWQRLVLARALRPCEQVLGQALKRVFASCERNRAVPGEAPYRLSEDEDWKRSLPQLVELKQSRNTGSNGDNVSSARWTRG